MNSWTVKLEQDGEDLILPLSDEILETVGWKTGDEIEFIRDGDSIILQKKTE